MDLRAVVMYDFEARENDELSINYGEEIIVLNDNVSDGWWLVRNNQLQEGIIPAAYVQLVSPPEPSIPPPAAPPRTQSPDEEEDWETDSDDDADDHNSSNTWYTPYPPDPSPTRPADVALRAQAASSVTATVGREESVRNSRPLTTGGDDITRAVALRKAINRNFMKSGADDFVLANDGSLKSDGVLGKTIIEQFNGSKQWQSPPSTFTCVIDNYKKTSKLHGMKNFVSYSLIPSFSGIQVSRRYKQFDWLYKRLNEKFIFACVPPLPDKQFNGRFDSGFIEERLRQLQSWLSEICRHPVLSQSRVLQHFITCTDEKKWKVGKREAEKDPFQGMKIFYTIQNVPREISWTEVLSLSGSLETFSTSYEKSAKMLADRAMNFNRKLSGLISMQYRSFSDGFKDLAESLAKEPTDGHASLCRAVSQTSSTYSEIAELFEKQPRRDGEKLVEELNESIRTASSLPGLMSLHKASAVIGLEAQREDGTEEKAIIASRCSVVADAVETEYNYQLSQRDPHLRNMMQSYLVEQIQFFSSITSRLQSALAMYESN